MKTAAQIVVIDDHRVVGLGVKAAFEDQGADASITWSPTVREARWKRGQVAVLDLRLADGSAPDTNIAYINGYGIPVVVYTSGDDPYLVRRAIAGGALSIIRKSAPPTTSSRPSSPPPKASPSPPRTGPRHWTPTKISSQNTSQTSRRTSSPTTPPVRVPPPWRVPSASPKTP